MSTNDVFSAAVTAMTHFGDVPWCGEIESISADCFDSVMVALDDRKQPAQSLLAWLYTLDPDRKLRHHHAGGVVFVIVASEWHGLRLDVFATFRGEDAAVLCEHEDDRGPISVHRLRAVQMRQTAALAGAE